MDKNVRKRSRKSKLVPRQYSDSDDENIAHMQQEIELEWANIKAQSILKKLSVSSLNQEKDIKFSVKVEIENCDDNESNDNEVNDTNDINYSIVSDDTAINTNNCEVKKKAEDVDLSIQEFNEVNFSNIENSAEIREDEINSVSSDYHDDEESDEKVCPKEANTDIRVESVRSLASSPTKILSYNITEKMISDEFEIVSKNTTNYADKLLEIRLRNFYSRHVTGAPNECETDIGIQDALKKWKCWQFSFPTVRGPPLIYICSECKTGFWHLHDFREHVKEHANINFTFVNEEHLSYVIGHYGRKADKLILNLQSECWRCGKGLKTHTDAIFKCNGCNRYFETCILMSIHEGICDDNKNKVAELEYTNDQHKCPVCPYVHWRREDLVRHMLGLHSVRTDVPMSWSSKKCLKCSVMYSEYTLHDCQGKPATHACMYCSRKFRTKHNIMIHYWTSPHNFKCRICKKELRKECMEQDHLVTHSDSYTSVFKCIICKDHPYFLEKKWQLKHKQCFHNRMTKTLFERVIVPKSLVEKFEIKEKSNQKVLDRLQKEADVVNINNTVVPKVKRNVVNIVNNKQILGTFKNIKQEVVHGGEDEECKDDTFKTKSSAKSKDRNKRKADINMDNDLEIKRQANANLVQIKEEPVDFLDIVAVEFNDTDEVDDMNLYNEVNDELKSGFEEMEGLNLPIKFEVKDETENVYDDASGNNIMDSHFSLQSFEEDSSINRYQKYGGERYVKMIHDEKDYYRCTKCDNLYTSFRKYLLHFVLHDLNKMACPQCLMEFQTIEELSCHVNIHIKYNFVCVHSIHDNSVTGNRKFQCKKCHEVLDVSEFFLHWERHLHAQEEGPLQQSECVVDMDGKPRLKEMILYFLKPEKYVSRTNTCKECNKRFCRKNDFKRHFIQHLLDDAYEGLDKYGNLKCQICGAGFQGSDRYKRHLRDHASLPVYKCDMCNKAFSDSSNFSKHKKVHNLSVLICDTCGKKFQNKMHLIKHLELHTTTKPIVCEKCSKIFYSQSQYKRHLKKTNRKYRCQICKAELDSVKEKWDHMWEVHKKRNCIADCPVCNASFRKKSDVKRHLHEEHGDHSLVHSFG